MSAPSASVATQSAPLVHGMDAPQAGSLRRPCVTSRVGETVSQKASSSEVSAVGSCGTSQHVLAAVAAPELSFWQHMLSGALAGTVEHLAMFPLDTVKTRMQAVPHGGAAIAHTLNYGSMRAAVNTVMRLEGVRGLYRGVDAMALGAGPAHAFYFATYEAAKRLLNAEPAASHPAATAVAGAAATVVADAILTPLDTVKQRLQIANSPYSGLADCAARTLRDEGWQAFYRSYRTTLVMNVPFTAVQFVVYESGKRALVASHLIDSTEEEGLLEQLLAGGAAGGAAAAITNPLDIAKTRLQTAGVWEPGPVAAPGASGPSGRASSAPRHSVATRVLPTLKEIVAKEGFTALATGIGPRVLFHVPAAAICWGTYETGKAAFTRAAASAEQGARR